MINKFLVLSYLAAIVVANNVVTVMGPKGLLITGFFLIPFDLISRDQLQDQWSGKSLGIKMTALILSGSVIAYAINPETKNVAIASALSFLIAGAVDFALYTALKGRHKMIKMNLSNIGSAACDSVLFQIIAFGGFSASIAVEQTCIKILGGLLWSSIFCIIFKCRYGGSKP